MPQAERWRLAGWPGGNGKELALGTETKAKLGDPRLLDLGSRGIRDIVFWQKMNVYVIVAGSATNTENFALFSWTIGEEPQELKDCAGQSIALRGLHPEALVLLATMAMSARARRMQRRTRTCRARSGRSGRCR